MHDYESTTLDSAAYLAALEGESDDMPDYEPSPSELADDPDPYLSAALGEAEWADAILAEVQPCPECNDSDPLCDYCHPF